jgi:two-component system response regulator HydG
LLKEEVNQLRTEVKSAFGFEGIVGISEGIRQVLAILPRVAQTDSTVLITGESGTGKELIARAVHASSRRAQGPFISVSSAAFPEHLLEDELFGHVKGAFTGALAARKGLLEDANSGTFFFDEIGEAPPAIQAKLLRVLEERSLRRLGDNRPVPVDIRFVAATNRDLQDAIRENTFREDLFYRLNVIRIHLPPLRDRKEDVPILTKHFLDVHCKRAGRTIDGLSTDALEALAAYNFPGNIRELSNVIEQAVALATGSLIELQDLPEKLFHLNLDAKSSVSSPTPPKGLAAMERDLVMERLRAHKGNLGLVAKDLGISRTTLWRRMKEYKI